MAGLKEALLVLYGTPDCRPSVTFTANCPFTTVPGVIDPTVTCVFDTTINPCRPNINRLHVNRPVFILYKMTKIPKMKKMPNIIRNIIKTNGISPSSQGEV